MLIRFFATARILSCGFYYTFLENLLHKARGHRRTDYSQCIFWILPLMII